MFVRRSLAAAATLAVVGSALAVAVPAQAAEADDPTFTPTGADLIGVGSDTIQHTLHLLATGGTVDGVAVKGWNGQTPAPASRIASFSATGGGTIALPAGAIPRPNGSGAGKALLYGAKNNTDVDFARSSSQLNTEEVGAGLQAFPFALDTLVPAVSRTVASNAPSSLTGAQILAIYKGDATRWNQVGGTSSATIKPLIPQAGSGTRSFFVAQLQALNGGTAVTLGSAVTEVQEHDDTPIKSDPNAIAPFSKGRAELLGTALRIPSGFSAQRALYDVVRGSDLGNATVQAVFGEDGFVCSTAARPLIEASGFSQLATPDAGGVCGQATQNPTSNFTLNQAVATTTSLTADSPAAGTIRLRAAVRAGTAPDGTVTFYEGSTVLRTGVPVIQGVATHQLSGVTGSHTYRAEFVPTAGTAFEPSQATASALARVASATTVSISPASSTWGKARTVRVTVRSAGKAAAGTVAIKVGSGATVNRTLSAGTASVAVPATLGAGRTAVTARYLGTTAVVPSSAAGTVTVSKASAVVRETYAASVKKGKRATGAVTVSLNGTSLKPTGTVTIKRGSKVVGTGRLSGGKATVRLAKLPKGKQKLVATYSGSANAGAGRLSFTIKQK
ncbi:PstS family phosphate ABC transporter substrate-binding protein [Solicola sp. PLA-1-18]|uniref:PstS family phosphate ABC transporter substrate-binding protein n=1 Tax=Solicola sp. PLA-1-18 TaxID=3380532 RepID=UPI003B800F66